MIKFQIKNLKFLIKIMSDIDNLRLNIKKAYSDLSNEDLSISNLNPIGEIMDYMNTCYSQNKDFHMIKNKRMDYVLTSKDKIIPSNSLFGDLPQIALPTLNQNQFIIPDFTTVINEPISSSQIYSTNDYSDRESNYSYISEDNSDFDDENYEIYNVPDEN